MLTLEQIIVENAGLSNEDLAELYNDQAYQRLFLTQSGLAERLPAGVGALILIEMEETAKSIEALESPTVEQRAFARELTMALSLLEGTAQNAATTTSEQVGLNFGSLPVTRGLKMLAETNPTGAVATNMTDIQEMIRPAGYIPATAQSVADEKAMIERKSEVVEWRNETTQVISDYLDGTRLTLPSLN